MRKPGLKILIIFTAIIVVGTMIIDAKQNRQPVEYNHKIHMEEAGLACLDCHLNAETHARALIPNINLCANCHDDEEVENEDLRNVANFALNETEVTWIQIHKVPDHTYFSHRRHVKLGQIDCSVCHGDVTQMEKPFVKTFVRMDMSWCMACHEQKAVTNDCSTCHR